MLIIRQKKFGKRTSIPSLKDQSKIINNSIDDRSKSPKDKRDCITDDTMSKVDSEGDYHGNSNIPPGKKIPKKLINKYKKNIRKGQYNIEFVD